MLLVQPHFSKFSLLEFIPYGKSIQQICNNNDPTTLQIKVYVDLFGTSLQPVAAAFAYQKDSPQTLQIVAEDLRRDRAYMGIKTEAVAKTYHFDDAVVAAANTILSCYKKYGDNVQLLEYNKESETIDQLIDDFEKDAIIKAAITLLDLGAWVAELKDANNKFKQLYLERTAQYATLPTEPAHKLRPAAKAAFDKLFAQINSRATIDETGKYNKLIAEANALTEQYNNNANRGGGGSKPPTPPPSK